MPPGTRPASKHASSSALSLAPSQALPRLQDFLPGVLAEIAEATSVEVAVKIAQAKGGRRVYLPARPAADHWLAQLVGHAAALAIGKAIAPGFGGIDMLIPMGPSHSNAQRWRVMHELIDNGRSKREIAAACGVHERTVQMHRNRREDMARVDASLRQLPLF